MPAYWIARAKINDWDEYIKYTDQVPGILAQFGGKVLCRGSECKTLEGPEFFERFVVIEFPSMEDAEACFRSDAYQSAASFRRQEGVAVNELTIASGGDTTPTS